ncbi:hypothetical protein BJX70DRAFT_69075 [Aspergillus crustosus]
MRRRGYTGLVRRFGVRYGAWDDGARHRTIPYTLFVLQITEASWRSGRILDPRSSGRGRFGNGITPKMAARMAEYPRPEASAFQSLNQDESKGICDLCFSCRRLSARAERSAGGRQIHALGWDHEADSTLGDTFAQDDQLVSVLEKVVDEVR